MDADRISYHPSRSTEDLAPAILNLKAQRHCIEGPKEP